MLHLTVWHHCHAGDIQKIAWVSNECHFSTVNCSLISKKKQFYLAGDLFFEYIHFNWIFLSIKKCFESSILADLFDENTKESYENIFQIVLNQLNNHGCNMCKKENNSAPVTALESNFLKLFPFIFDLILDLNFFYLFIFILIKHGDTVCYLFQ